MLGAMLEYARDWAQVGVRRGGGARFGQRHVGWEASAAHAACAQHAVREACHAGCCACLHQRLPLSWLWLQML